MRNWLICILITFCMVLNNTAASSFILTVMLFILLVQNHAAFGKLLTIKLFLLLSFGLSFLMGYINGLVLTQVLRLIALVILFWTYPIKYDLQKRHLTVLVIVGFYLIAMQIGKTLGIPALNNFVETYYPVEKNYWGTNEFDSVSEIFAGFSNRLGGIYYNPNVMGQSVLILYVAIIIGLIKHFSRLFVFVVTLVFFLSILLTGARTAMAVFIVINLVMYRKSIQKRLVIWIPVLVALVAAAISYGSLLEFRAFYNITDSFSENESGGQKLEILLTYLKSLRIDTLQQIVLILFGHADWDRQFDADPGYVLSFAGVVGGILMILFFMLTYRRTASKYRFVFLLFLISITATIVINYRFSILIFLILSLVNSQRVNQEEERGALTQPVLS